MKIQDVPSAKENTGGHITKESLSEIWWTKRVKTEKLVPFLSYYSILYKIIHT
jgi:hypothetical protein